MKLPRKSFGFTLVELLIVIAIIGILISVGLASFRRAQTQTRDGQRKADLENIAGALEQYYSDNNEYPTSLDDLTSGARVYLKAIPRDPSTDTEYGAANYINPTTQTYCLIIVDLEINPTDLMECPADGANYEFVVSPLD
ncbi:MAG: hypothetical protein A2Z24_02385 [Candidatus Woykebacteria bacterium RBG_16_44_10]|uniref:Type II secretion system protein GspG C-terminal domain-containing protein n=1 Tax=Candidatus Woykebacteria bacterium RBG_16_44_10 TaxID=1802597 RepID=A0A1G1WDY0_9BACT|nr:MAG: hypothetical protein A2Z24_02385 [Candidatus Woykebacteria bacterium RBG_16_44_10]